MELFVNHSGFAESEFLRLSVAVKTLLHGG